MTEPRVYLDHAATTPLDDGAREAMLEFLDAGNPSSMHASGARARGAIDRARHAIAHLIGAEAREVILTSGGTEADCLAIRGALERHADRGRHVVTSTVEHDAVLETCTALESAGLAEITRVECDGAGRVDAADVAAAVRDDTIVVSVMLANNEVGSIQEIAEIVAAVRERNPHTLIHTDAVQAVGHIQVDVRDLGVDMLSLSGHKFYGPKGCGALYLRHGSHIAAQLTGGGQERGRRSGTENVAAIVGTGYAAQLASQRLDVDAREQREHARNLLDMVVAAVPDAVLTGSALQRLPHIASLAIPGAHSEVLVSALDLEGIEVSAGSACSSGAQVASHVLAAMGMAPRVAQGALRVSVGRGTTDNDIHRAATAIVATVLHGRIIAR